MKFTNGYWLVRDGFTALHPVQAYDIERRDGELTAYGATKRIETRGDTLDRTLITVSFSSPCRNVVRVRITHWEGSPGAVPMFTINEEPGFSPVITDDGKTAILTSGDLSVTIGREGPWGYEFLAGGKRLTASESKGAGYVVSNDGGAWVHEELSLGIGELVYGLGERFTPFVKNGQTVDIWNRDGGTASDQAYKNIPFYITNAGYGVFVNHPGMVSFEVASEKVQRTQFSVKGESLEYFLIHGKTPSGIIERYTFLTGRPALPPGWSFGLWLSTSFTTSYDERTVTGFIEGMKERGLPLHVFHFDCFWMKEFEWCNFTWDDRTFPDPSGMISRLKKKGLRICLWINPYIAQRSPLFTEAASLGYLLKRPDGSVWQWDRWQAGMGVVDFTNPDACRWFQEKLEPLLDMGVDAFKTDFGERIPTEVVYSDGSDPERMHNYYTYLYNRTVFDLIEKRRGRGEAVVFARSATAGSQCFPVHWGGDCESTFESMAESLRGGLSLGLCGFGFWSHDIGGFEGTPPASLFKRWIAFGLLSSHSRLHGSRSYRVPWLVDEESVDVLRIFTKLKCSLMPYIYAAAVEASKTGVPVMRPMFLEFPDDPTCAFLDRQYMLGSSLLVAPVFREDGGCEFYVPAGRWTHFLTGTLYEGGRWYRDTFDVFSLPLLVRPGSVIPVGAEEAKPDYDYAENVELRLYEPVEGVFTLEIPASDGTAARTFAVAVSGHDCTVTPGFGKGSWSVSSGGRTAVSGADTSKPLRLVLKE